MIDDPTPREQRRGTRSALLWGIGIAIVLGAAAFVWVFVIVPQEQLGGPGGTARQTHRPTGNFANQGSGQSGTAKNNAVVPQTNARVGAGQNSPAAAAQIEKSAGPLQLSDQQRANIRSYFAANKPDRIDSTDFAVVIGAAVPKNVQLQPLPPTVSSAMGGYQDDQYILVRNQLVIVDQNARRVVAIVPDAG